MYTPVRYAFDYNGERIARVFTESLGGKRNDAYHRRLQIVARARK